MSQADRLQLLEVADREAWRAWLTAHGGESSGVWLAVGKKGGHATQLTYEEAVEEAVAHGWIDSTARKLDEDRYQQLFTPRKRGSAWSPSNKERVRRLTSEGRMAPGGIAAVEAAKADGSWEALDDVEALVVPDDLTAALAAQPEAARRFEAFTSSAKKQMLWWIATAKRPETRAKRIAESVRLAAEGRTLAERD